MEIVLPSEVTVAPPVPEMVTGPVSPFNVRTAADSARSTASMLPSAIDPLVTAPALSISPVIPPGRTPRVTVGPIGFVIVNASSEL